MCIPAAIFEYEHEMEVMKSQKKENKSKIKIKSYETTEESHTDYKT